jgi:hypothetical protein
MRCLLLIGLLTSLTGFSQTAPVRPKLMALPNPNPTRWNLNIQFTDMQGRPFANLYEGIEGSAYLFPDFRWGQLETNKGKSYDSVQLSLDLYHHELHVLMHGKEIVVQDGLVHWLSIRDTVEGKPTESVFQSGFPAIDKNTATHFYQVLSVGNPSLLLHRKRQLEKTTDVMSGLTQERFVPIEQLYVFDGTSIRRLERDSKFLEQLFEDRAARFQAYLRTHKINVKNRTQLIELFEAMNAGEWKAF